MTRKEIIEEIVNDKEFKKACYNISRGHSCALDLYQDTILAICETEEGKLVSIYNRDEIRWYIVGIISRLWHNNRTNLRPKEIITDTNCNAFTSEQAEEYDIDSDKLLDKQAAMIQAELERMQSSNRTEWYKALLFAKYMQIGSRRKLSELTKIPRASIGLHLKETMNNLKQRVND